MRSFAGGSSTDKILITNYAAMNALLQYTIAFRAVINAYDTVTFRRLANKRTSGTPGQGLFMIYYIHSPGDLIEFEEWNWGTTAGQWSIPGTATGSEFTFVLTYDGGSTSNDPVFYINDVSQTVTRVTGPAGTRQSETADLYLGASNGTTPHDGTEGEFALWNRILTRNEITALHLKFEAALLANGLVCYLPLIGRYSPELNLAPNALTGTVTGTTTSVHPPMIRRHPVIPPSPLRPYLHLARTYP